MLSHPSVLPHPSSGRAHPAAAPGGSVQTRPVRTKPERYRVASAGPTIRKYLVAFTRVRKTLANRVSITWAVQTRGDVAPAAQPLLRSGCPLLRALRPGRSLQGWASRSHSVSLVRGLCPVPRPVRGCLCWRIRLWACQTAIPVGRCS